MWTDIGPILGNYTLEFCEIGMIHCFYIIYFSKKVMIMYLILSNCTYTELYLYRSEGCIDRL